MRDELPYKQGIKPQKYETGIINLDKSAGEGTHWVAYVKKGKHCEYFDSYGDLRPPKEFLEYMRQDAAVKIFYNYNNVQKGNSYNCGHLCLSFLLKACTCFLENK